MPTSNDMKPDVRRGLLAARRRSAESPERCSDGPAGEQLRDAVMALPEMAGAARCAIYLSLPGEPPTQALGTGLLHSGRAVLAPVLLPDRDLDWAAYDERAVHSTRPRGVRGLLEPSGPRLGREALHDVDIVVAPGLAVDRHGNRLGRGGGSYDRALSRLQPGALVVVLLWDDEVGVPVPVEPHDRSVHVAVTPAATYRFPLLR